MYRWTIVVASLVFCGGMVGSLHAKTYFFEDFERADSPIPQCWWHPANLGKARAYQRKSVFGETLCADRVGQRLLGARVAQTAEMGPQGPGGRGQTADVPLHAHLRSWRRG